MYKYLSLTNPQSIRVLELQPEEKNNSDLVTRLLEVSIDDPPNFEALSYAWEGQSFDQGIVCDEERLLISATCKAALRRLRLKTKNRLLWIDQICINQTSLEEKNHQVAIMGEIYSRAKRTIVWLGTDPRSDELLQHGWELRLVKACKLPLMSGYFTTWYRRRRAFKSLNNLTSIMWFNRIWTIQEVALAQQVRVVSSTREMDYDKFMDDWMDFHWRWFKKYMNSVEVDLIDARATVRHVLRRKRIGKLKLSGERLSSANSWRPMSFLCAVTASASSYPSDKIFAMNGIMKELGFPLPDPDYSMDYGEVYWKACSELMARTSSLQPLTLVNGLHWDSNFPSWVPDFNGKHPMIAETKWHPKEFLGKGSASHKQARFTIDNHRVIATQAKVVDLIHGRIYQRLEGQPERSSDYSLGLAEQVRELIHAVHCLQSWILASEKLENFTLADRKHLNSMVDLMFNHENSSFLVERDQDRLLQLLWISAYHPGEIYSLFYESIDSNTREIFLRTPEIANLLHLPEVQLLGVLGSEGLLRELDVIKALVQENAFFWTKGGHLGTAHHAAAVGDVVVFIPGIKVPMLLRPTQPNTYQVIGPAYVTGISQVTGPSYGRAMLTGELCIVNEYPDWEKEFEDNNVCNIFLV
jgi:hypothetical protein